MIEYWHWHTLPYGTETYWGGVLPHSLEPGRVYGEVAELGAELAAIGTTLDGYEPDADVAILWSNDSRFALRVLPAARDPRRPARPRVLPAHRRRVPPRRRRRGRAVAHPARRRRRTSSARSNSRRGSRCSSRPGSTSRRMPTSTCCATTRRPAVTSSSASARATATRRRGRASRSHPTRLHEAAGVRYEEFSNLSHDVPVTATGRPRGIRRQRARSGPTGSSATAPRRARRLRAPAVLRLPGGHDERARRRAHHGRRHGAVARAGRRPRALGRSRRRSPTSSPPDRALPVTVSSGSLPDGATRLVRLQLGMGAAGAITLAASVTDPVTGDQLRRAPSSHSPAWSTRTLSVSEIAGIA